MTRPPLLDLTAPHARARFLALVLLVVGVAAGYAAWLVAAHT